MRALCGQYVNDHGVNDVDDNYEDNGDDKYKGNKHERPSS